VKRAYPITTPISASLERYADLLVERAVPLGFVAEGDRPRIWERHVLDSLRVVPLIPSKAGEAVDIGSGAGLPGVVVAAARPDLAVALLDAQRKRVAFLEYVVDELGLVNARVVHGRAEDAPVSADVAFARAVGSANVAWRLARGLLRPGGSLLYFAGRSWTTRDEAHLSSSSVVTVRDQGVSGDVGPIVMISQHDGSATPHA